MYDEAIAILCNDFVFVHYKDVYWIMSKTCILICTFPEEEPEPERRTIDCTIIYDCIIGLWHRYIEVMRRNYVMITYKLVYEHME